RQRQLHGVTAAAPARPAEGGQVMNSKRNQRVVAGAFCLALLTLTTALALQGDKPQAGAATGQFETRVIWDDGKPHVEIAIETQAKVELKEIPVSVDLLDPQGLLISRTALKVPAAGPGEWKGRFPLQNIKEPKKQHRLSAMLVRADLGIDATEEILF